MDPGERTPREGSASGGLGDEMAALVQQEVERMTATFRAELDELRREAGERGRDLAAGAGYLGAAGGLALVSAGALLALPVLALRRFLPGWAVAVLVAGGSAAAAGTLGVTGAQRLREAAPESVRQEVGRVIAELQAALRERVRVATSGGAPTAGPPVS
jgi:hypothetical protein